MWVGHNLDPHDMESICNLRQLWARGVVVVQWIQSVCCCGRGVKEGEVNGARDVVQHPLKVFHRSISVELKSGRECSSTCPWSDAEVRGHKVS